tara:strand:- start:603 stop:1181 length:579 start_codon:yes stop_codon:yes gene_type:complete
MSMTAMGIGLTQTAGKPDGSGGFVAIPIAEVAQYTQAPLGFTHIQPASSQMTAVDTDVSFQSGDREWIYVYNAMATPLTQGMVCIRFGVGVVGDAIVTASIAAAPINASAIIGVAQHEIPAGFCGFILRKGAGNVTMEAGATPLVALLSGTANDGQAQSASGGGAVVSNGFGYALEATAAPGLVKAYLGCNG